MLRADHAVFPGEGSLRLSACACSFASTGCDGQAFCELSEETAEQLAEASRCFERASALTEDPLGKTSLMQLAAGVRGLRAAPW